MKNFKKVLSLVLACAIMLGTFGIVSADMSFNDMTSAHWGWSYVQTLVGDGTINGYQDGTFRPEANVTRAEFVKMIGKTDKAFAVPFDDISGHWAYDYIMYSDMDVEGTSFNPDVAITRNDVINLLWKRAGSPKATSPSVITNQSTNEGAAAWAYAYGIMNGDDGLNLRLSDGVTRAEAAALICRSRTIDYSSVKSFADTVDSRILEEVYEGVTGEEYDAEKTYTVGELTGMAMKLAYDTTTPMFEKLGTNYSVDRPNTFAFYTACKYVLGEDKMTEEYYDATATNLDAVALMMFAANYKNDVYMLDFSTDELYADVASVNDKNMNGYVTGAYKYGIRLDNSNNIYPTQNITGKNLALLLVQLDAASGFNSAYDVTLSDDVKKDIPVKTDVMNYPNTADRYRYVADGVPNIVLSSDYIDENGNVCTNAPKDIFKTARDHNPIFIFSLQQVIASVKTLGADISVVYYPSMVAESERGYIMKVKITVKSVESGKSFDDVFPNSISSAKPELKSGLTFYATFATGSKISGMNIPIDNATFTSIDYIY